MKKKSSLNECIWLIILLCFAYYFISLLITGKIRYYVHPKMLIYAAFAAIVFTILGIYQFTKVFSCRQNSESVRKGYFLFAFPLILGICFNPSGLSTEAGSYKGTFRLDAEYFKSVVQTEHNHSGYDRQLLESSTIEVNEKNYLYVFNEFNKHPDKFLGKEFIFTGFVYEDKRLGSDKFLSGRMMLSCCAADAQLIGFICTYKEIENLMQGEWVRVTGTYGVNGKIVTQTGSLPLLKVTKLEKVKEPLNKYIYQ